MTKTNKGKQLVARALTTAMVIAVFSLAVTGTLAIYSKTAEGNTIVSPRGAYVEDDATFIHSDALMSSVYGYNFYMHNNIDRKPSANTYRVNFYISIAEELEKHFVALRLETLISGRWSEMLYSSAMESHAADTQAFTAKKSKVGYYRVVVHLKREYLGDTMRELIKIRTAHQILPNMNNLDRDVNLVSVDEKLNKSTATVYLGWAYSVVKNVKKNVHQFNDDTIYLDVYNSGKIDTNYTIKYKIYGYDDNLYYDVYIVRKSDGSRVGVLGDKYTVMAYIPFRLLSNIIISEKTIPHEIVAGGMQIG